MTFPDGETQHYSASDAYTLKQVAAYAEYPTKPPKCKWKQDIHVSACRSRG
jgi:hypothetical protein